MYKVFTFGTKEYQEQEVQKAELRLKLAIVGFTTFIVSNDSASSDVDFLSESMDLLDELNYQYKDAVNNFNNKYGEEK